ncbi:helix-turn-helix domain-containing protein [uncultured Subdoligranulum sp.]|uniref:helix-turn-helix domain-containing protein n=1 Tax=uncultured Subdoligranulum sp. TaxID=512298 RepID=UPI0025ED042F|nr:helix-turn-helix transcriptional regulator [uncultured Subdoligranulum sp.]
MIGRNCRRLRQRAGLTQEELAERLHVTRQAVSAWETEKNHLDAETLVVLAEALGADVQELLYGPGVVQAPFARYQRRYLVCTVLSAAVVIAWLIMEVTLKPYLIRQAAQTFIPYPGMAYFLTVPPLGVLGLGCLFPSLISLWVDIRVRSIPVRRVLLALGLLALCYYLVWMTWYLGLWPDFLYGLEPVQFLMWHWFIPLFTGDHELLRLGPLFLSGGFLFLTLNR